MGIIVKPGQFRLALALLVVVSHVSNLAVGTVSVLLFFYLSGYWTARIWTEKFSGRMTGSFYLARYLRIAPLYFLVLVVSALLLHNPVGLLNWTLIGVSDGPDPVGVSWSLDVELQFYLVVPLLMAVLPLLTARTAFALSLIVGAFGCWLYSETGVLTAAKYLPIFLLGVLTHTRSYVPSERTAVVSLGLFGVMTAVTFFTPFMWKVGADPFDAHVYAFLWMLPLVPYVARSLSVRSDALDRHMGNLSYPVYLVHCTVFALMPGQKLLGLAVVAVVSLLVYVLFDRPADAWRARVTAWSMRLGPRLRVAGT